MTDRLPPNDSPALPNIIMGGTSLLGDLTGIGHYTRELTGALVSQQLLGDLKLWGDVSFLDAELVSRVPQKSPAPAGASPQRRSLRRSLRRVASRSYRAAMLYEQLSGQVAGWRLAAYSESHIYHSPNFILPRYEGRKVMTVHDLSVIRFPEFHRKQMVEICERGIRRAIEERAHIIVDSDLVGRELVAHFGVNKAAITTIHLGANDNYRPRTAIECRAVLDSRGLQYQSFFLSVGTIEPRKNLLRVFDAFRAGRQEGLFDWPLVVVGGAGWKSSEEHEALRALCRDGLALYLNYVDDTTLQQLYSAAGALIFASLYEGFGLPVAEALASGCPVVTSRGTAMEEFAGPRATLVDPLDTGALRDAMALVAQGSLTAVGPVTEPTRGWHDVAAETAQVYAMSA